MKYEARYLSAWQPVSSKPEANGPYLVYQPERTLDRFAVQDWDQIEGSFSNDFGITHWMPLPGPPEAEKWTASPSSPSG